MAKYVNDYSVKGLATYETKSIYKRSTLRGLTKWILTAQVLFLWLILGRFLPGATWFFLPLVWVINRRVLLTIALPYNIAESIPSWIAFYNAGLAKLFWTMINIDVEASKNNLNGTYIQGVNSTITHNAWFTTFNSYMTGPYGMLIVICLIVLMVLVMGTMLYGTYITLKFEWALFKLQKRIRREFGW